VRILTSQRHFNREVKQKRLMLNGKQIWLIHGPCFLEVLF
jgi:hypothetical protein